LIGCGKAPQSVSVAKPEPTPSASREDFSGISPAASRRGDNSGESPPQSAAAEAEAGAIFRSAAANDALERYLSARAAIREIPAPALINSGDPLANHAAIISYVNELSRRLNTLKTEQAAVQQNLDPNEKKRFKALQHQLSEEQEEQ
jgi:hypothetical protein